MSGGSFDYLYDKRDWDLLNSLHLLNDMCDYLKENAPGSAAHKLAKKQRNRVRNMREIIMETNIDQGLLSPVFHAVEWHVSGDRSKEHVMDAIQAFEKRRNK